MKPHSYTHSVTTRLLLWALLVASLVITPACDKASPVSPAGTTITLSVNPTRIDVTGNATVTAIVRRENGSPVNPGTIVNFSTTLGSLDPDDAPTDDTGVAETGEMLEAAGDPRPLEVVQEHTGHPVNGSRIRPIGTGPDAVIGIR